jgi:DNA-binding NtrC family response regulator
MVDIRAEVDALVRQFVDDLEQLVRRAALEAVKEALEAEPTGSAAAGPATRPAGGAPRRRRARRSKAGREELARALVEHIGAHPGAKMEDIKEALGEETKTLRPIVNRLLSDGQLRKEGERRATRYFPGEGG